MFLHFIPLLLSLCYVSHPRQSRRFWSRIFLADHYPRVTGKLKPRIDRRAVSSRSRKRNPNLRVAAIRRHYASFCLRWVSWFSRQYPMELPSHKRLRRIIILSSIIGEPRVRSSSAFPFTFHREDCLSKEFHVR